MPNKLQDTSRVLPPNQLRTLEAADFVNLLNGAPAQNVGNVLFQTHTLPTGRDRIAAKIPIIGSLAGRSSNEGIVTLTGHFLTWQHRGRHSILVLAHAREAIVTADHRVIIRCNSGRNKHLPQLCRPKPLAALINALVDGRIHPDAQHRSSCLNCANLGPDRRCRLNPDPASPGVCCPSQPHQDWCSQHQPTVNRAS